MDSQGPGGLHTSKSVVGFQVPPSSSPPSRLRSGEQPEGTHRPGQKHGHHSYSSAGEGGSLGSPPGVAASGGYFSLSGVNSFVSSPPRSQQQASPRPVSMLSKQIGNSLKRLSGHLRRLSSSRPAPIKEDSSGRGSSKGDVSNRSNKGGMSSRRESSGMKRESTGCALPTMREEGSPDPVSGGKDGNGKPGGDQSPGNFMFFRPSAPLWAAGCEYEAESVAPSQPSDRGLIAAAAAAPAAAAPAAGAAAAAAR